MFIDNPSMAYITFDNNLMKHVAPKVFDHLNYLVTLYIRGNPCLDDISDNNRANTIWIMFRIMVYCPPTFDMIEDKLVNGNKLQGKFNLARTETNQQINELGTKTDEMIVAKINPLSDAMLEITERLDEIPIQIEANVADQINPVNFTMFEMMETMKVMEQRIKLLEGGV